MGIFYSLFGLMLITSRFWFVMIAGSFLSSQTTEDDMFPEQKAEAWANKHSKLFRFLYLLGFIVYTLGFIIEFGWIGVVAPFFLWLMAWVVVKVMDRIDQ